jgi:hypothetical protein
MATSVVTYQPAAGRAHVDLTSWAGDAGFATTPVATDQMEGPDTLTLNADGTVTGADGTYTMRHIIASSGQAEGISYQIGTPAVVPAGTITLGTPTIDQTTISLPFTYDDTDQTGFEYRVDGGAWTSTTSPVSLSGLTENTKYTIEVRAVNADGGGTPASTALTTDPIPSSATATVPFSPGAGYTVATLEAGFDDYAFQEWPANEPDVGWQLVTVTAEGYFDSQGNYWFDEGVEAVHDVWVVDLNGTVYYQTVDNTGLLTPLEGEITIGTVTVGRNSASIEFSYSAADAEGFEYRLDGGTWIDVVSPIALSGLTAETPYQVDLRAYNGTTQSVFKTVNFTTDAAVDTTPNAFTLTAQTGVARSITVTSNAITVQGVDAGVDVVSSVSGDTGSQQSVSTDGGVTWGGWSAADQNVRLNYRVRVRHTTSDEHSSGGYDGVRETTLTIGGVSATFRSTTLADTTPPVISLTGGNQTVVQNTTWSEPGYEAIDNADGDISVTGVEVIGTVDTSVLGQQQILYRATDASGNVSESTRTVTVVEFVPDDTVAPIIQLAGGNRTITVGDTWSDPGYTATDDTDGNITDQVEVSGTVDTTKPGSYPITYSVSDAAGNEATATRIVTVLSATQYPLLEAAPANRTFEGKRVLRFEAGEPIFILQSGEVLDFDFDLTNWLADQGDDIAEGTHQVAELAEALEVVDSGNVPGTDRIKVWLQAGDVKDSQSSLVQLKVTTTGARTAVFQFRALIINRMQ